MRTLSITELQRNVDHWIQTVGNGYFSELTNNAMLAEEVGEVSRLIAREFGEQKYKLNERPVDFKSALADELADVIFIITCFSNQLNIDLSSAIQSNMEKKWTRDAERYKKRVVGGN